MYSTCMSGANEGHKRSELTELWLQIVIRHNVGAGIESWSSARAIVAVTTERSLQPLCISFMGVIMVDTVLCHWKILYPAPED